MMTSTVGRRSVPRLLIGCGRRRFLTRLTIVFLTFLPMILRFVFPPSILELLNIHWPSGVAEHCEWPDFLTRTGRYGGDINKA